MMNGSETIWYSCQVYLPAYSEYSEATRDLYSYIFNEQI